MSNNGPINPSNGQISFPFVPVAPTPNPAPVSIPASGGWYVFQSATASPGQTIYIDGIGGGGGAAVPAAEKKINKDGCRCKKCREFYPYAEANQEDGTLICYVCRKGL